MSNFSLSSTSSRSGGAAASAPIHDTLEHYFQKCSVKRRNADIVAQGEDPIAPMVTSGLQDDILFEGDDVKVVRSEGGSLSLAFREGEQGGQSPSGR